MPLFEETPRRLERRHVDNLFDYVDNTDTSHIARTVNTLDGNGHCYVEEKMASRYASSIQEGENAQGETIRFRARTDYAKRAAIEAGLFEIVQVGLLPIHATELGTI